MTATIRRPDPEYARHRRTKMRRARFSSMESLGFIETPTTVTSQWVSQEARSELPPPPIKRGAHEKTVADIEPLDTTGELLRRDVRWGMVITLAVVVAGLTAAGVWLWHRPAAMAEAASSAVSVAAADLEPELEGLDRLNQQLLDSQMETSEVIARTLSVDGAARKLFDAASGLPTDSEQTARTVATDVATTALDASRLVSDAIAYRSAVIQILTPPDLEADPELIGLEDAVREIGTWRQTFEQVRLALPEGTMSDVSVQLGEIAASLESIQKRYVDGLGQDDRQAAEAAVLELEAQLDIAENLLNRSLRQVQEQADELIRDSFSGIRRLLG